MYVYICILHAVSADMVEAVFYLCAYKFAIRTVNSLWCYLIDESAMGGTLSGL